MSTALQSWFEIVSRQRATLCERIGLDEACGRLQLVQELMARMPCRFLLAASKAEIQAAGRVMLSEGRSAEDMKNLQDVVVAMLDDAHATGVLPKHPLRDPHMGSDDGMESPEAALVVGVGRAGVHAIGEILGTAEIELYTVSSVELAVRRATWFPFGFILTVVPSVKPVAYLGAVRATTSLCRTAGLVLLTHDGQMESASTYVGRGANRVVALSELATQLPNVITELGMVSERTRVRLKTHVDLDSGESDTWHSENISSSGMLLRTPKEISKGTEVDLHFTVPGDELPIHVRAKVVRNTTFGREDFTGAGVRFLSFVGEGRHRLELFLRRGTH